ncbi:unnamed protein product [Schistosoma guineensis]|nr:unnamed protein product [Schistosoma guineensis]
MAGGSGAINRSVGSIPENSHIHIRKKPIQKIIILCNALVHLQYWTSISAKDHNMNNLDFMFIKDVENDEISTDQN